eukprot:m.38965 g.38965  ORF g.38965 m.38965 type:complete len:102 (-) comp10250_c0_seq14:409-714(-)
MTGLSNWREYFQVIRSSFVKESAEVFLSGSDKCIVRLKEDRDQVEFKLSRVSNTSDVRKSIQTVLMKMSTGTSSPLYWKTVENLNDERVCSVALLFECEGR